MDTEEKKNITKNDKAESAGNAGKGNPAPGESGKNGGHGRHGNRGRNRRPEGHPADKGADASRTQPAPAAKAENTGHDGNAAPAARTDRQDGQKNGNRHGKSQKKGRGANRQRPRDTSASEADEALEELRAERNSARQNEQKKRGEQKKPKDTKPGKQTVTETETPVIKDTVRDFSFTKSSQSVSREYEMELDRMPVDPTLDAVFGNALPETKPTEGTEVVGVHFPQGGKVYWFDPAGISFREGSKVIVETARGTEMGEVAVANRLVPTESIVPPLRPVIREATEADTEHEAENARKCVGAMKICAEKVEKHGLGMKLVGAQYTFDNAKLIFYFTAAARVDFRELVKDLASEFRTRIELRQIGIRDEAKMLGGRGICGRKLCCSSFLPNYAQVSVKMAKEQGLSLNSSKISGNCGRLMCCLKYEQSTYERELETMPAPDSVVDTPDGRGTVTEVKPISYALKVKLDEKPDQPPRQYPLADIKIVRKVAYRHDDTPDTDEDIN